MDYSFLINGKVNKIKNLKNNTLILKNCTSHLNLLNELENVSAYDFSSKISLLDGLLVVLMLWKSISKIISNSGFFEKNSKILSTDENK